MMNPPYAAMQIPFSQEAEQALLGSILTDSQHYPVICAIVQGKDFFLARHRYIWQACQTLSERHDAIDYLTVINELKTMGKLEEIGGGYYLTTLLNNAPALVHAETYARLIQRTSLRREMLAIGDQMKALALNEAQTTECIRAEMMKMVVEINGVELDGRDCELHQLISETCDFVDYRMEHPEALIGLPTGFRDLDKLLLGFQKTDLIILAAVPGMGKTSLMLSMAHKIAKMGKKVGIASLEMSASQLVKRLIAIESSINLQSVRSGIMTPVEHKRFVEAVGNLEKLNQNLFITDRKLTPDELRAKVMNWKANNGLDILFVDYLQIMSGGGLFKANDRTREVGYFARSLKEIAKELHIPVVAVAQLNRTVNDRQDKRPALSDLRESGEIEQEADVAMFLYRDEYYNPTTAVAGQADIIIQKHRNGPTGTVTLYFEKTLTKFMNAADRGMK